MAEKVFDRRVLYPGQKVFSEGDNGLAMFYVERGRVRIWKGNEVDNIVLTEITDGGIFGEMAMIDDKPRSAHATVVEETVLHAIPADKMKEKLEKTDPFVRAVLRILVENMRTTQKNQR